MNLSELRLDGVKSRDGMARAGVIGFDLPWDEAEVWCCLVRCGMKSRNVFASFCLRWFDLKSSALASCHVLKRYEVEI